MVFVFVILPPRSIGLGSLLEPYGVILLLLIALAGSCWVMLGGLVHASAGGRGAALVRRTSSIVVALFSVLIVTGVATALPAVAKATHPTPELKRGPAANGGG